MVDLGVTASFSRCPCSNKKDCSKNGDVTNNQLSQLLLVNTASISDILELLKMFDIYCFEIFSNAFINLN